MGLKDYLFYEEPGIQLYCGDCREVLPLLSTVNSVITDPVWPNCPSGRMIGSENPQALFNAVVPLLQALTLRLIIVLGSTSDPRFLSSISFPFICLRYLRYALPSYRGRLLYGGDVAYCFGALPAYWPDNYSVCPGEHLYVHTGNPWGNGTGHPAARQLEHMTALVNWWGEDLILDPFTGSGTTIIAAKNLGRHGIGIEIEPKYCELTVKRLRQEVLPLGNRRG